MVDTGRLVDDASRGDAQAVAGLLAHYLPRIEAYLRRHAVLPPGRESAADLAQSVCREVLERLADNRFDYRGEAAFKQWLYQAAILKARERQDYHWAQRRDPRREHQAADSRHDVFFESMCSPSSAAVRREELEKLRAAFAALSEDYRVIIGMARIEGRSHREIAADLNITESHSRVLLSRALARLATAARTEM